MLIESRYIPIDVVLQTMVLVANTPPSQLTPASYWRFQNTADRFECSVHSAILLSDFKCGLAAIGGIEGQG